jgi:cell filamentation protein
MTRYDTSSLPEAQFEPGSRGRVLRNRLGIRSKKAMDEAEAVALKSTLDYLLGQYDANHRFTVADIQMMHRVWLSDIYEWAGKLREVNVSKDDFPFVAARQIPLLMNAFEREFLSIHTPCTFRDTDRVVRALAEVHVELVLIHPFREGNGRVSRILATLMAAQAGLPLLDFGCLTGKKKDSYFAAVRAGLERNYAPMEEIFRFVISWSTNPRKASR